VILNIFLIFIFTVAINWCVSLQILAQSKISSQARILSIFISIILGILAGAIAIL